MRPSSTVSRRLAGTHIPWHFRLSRRVCVSLLSGTMLLLVGCGSESSTMVSRTPTPDHCKQYKNPPGRQPATGSSSCSGAHCYGLAEWVGQGRTLSTSITTVALAVSSPTAQFIDNEEWLSDHTSNPTNPRNWVETGYGTFTSSGATYTFWADNRIGSSFYLYVLNPISPGTMARYSIDWGGSNSNAFAVTVSTTDCTTMTSTDNHMSTTNTVSDIGLEAYGGNSGGSSFCGGAGMSAANADFTNINLDPSLNAASYSLLDDPSQGVTASVTPTSGPVSTLTTSC